MHESSPGRLTRQEHWSVDSYRPAERPAKVVVAGAGVAGMEAARVAARLGHEVVVFERKPEVGGQLNLWSRLPDREVIHTTVDWYRRQLEELGVAMHLNTSATRELILAQHPGAVIVATGSRYVANGESAFVSSPIPGAERDFVYAPEQILEDGARPTGKVLLLDEERIHTGWGIAEILAQGGAEVEIVTRDLHLTGEAIYNSYEFAFVLNRMKRLGVTIKISTYLRKIGDHTATVYDVVTGEEQMRHVDAVVLATMRRQDESLARALDGKVEQLFSVGDALSPRYLFEATYEGQRFARLIGVPGAPRSMREAFSLFNPLPPEVFPRSAASVLSEPRPVMMG